MSKRFVLAKDANPNYLATICRIGEIFPIEGADKLVKTVVNIGCFFSVLCLGQPVAYFIITVFGYEFVLFRGITALFDYVLYI